MLFLRPQKLPHFLNFYHKHGQKDQIKHAYVQNATSAIISEFWDDFKLEKIVKIVQGVLGACV